MMTSLSAALHSISWDLIALIGRRHGLGIDSNLPKTALIDKVAARLSERGHLSQFLPQLQPAERQLLTDLILAGGRLELHHLSRRYGRLRTHRALLRACRQQSPLSAPEQLLTLGFLFVDSQSIPHALFIPADLIDLLPAPALPSPPAPPFSTAAWAPVDRLGHDLATLLARLQREAVVPLHGRWLPPRFLATWGRACVVAPASPRARSELQTDRRRFLHYLAESGGWVLSRGAREQRSGGELSRRARGQKRRGEKKNAPLHPGTPAPLLPGPAAWVWLNGSRAERLQALWEIWTRPDPALWAAFRLPGTGWLTAPDRLLGPLHQALLELDPAEPERFAGWLVKRQPALQALVPANLVEPLETLTDTIVRLLRGPLVWLGVLSINNEQLAINNAGLSMLQASFGDDGPTFAKFAVTSDIHSDPLASSLTLTLREGLPEPVDLAVAIELSESEHVPPHLYHYLITPVSFVRALHRGWSPPALRDALERLADRRLTGQETELLRAWAAAANRMTIRPATLLETTDPAIITRLAGQRRGRALIHRTLSPRAVVVDPAKQAQLVRRLTRQEGVPPFVPGRSGAGTQGRKEKSASVPQPHRSSAPPLPRASAQHLWLALQVYRGLAQHIRLPVRIPQTILDQVAANADPAGLASAEIAAEQTLAALRQLIDGRTPFPPWPEEGLPEAESLPLIEAALAGGHNLELHYYAASTDRLTRRVVEPYRLEWHGPANNEQLTMSNEQLKNSENPKSEIKNRKSGTPYLVGFCHHAQAERTFRVDRIQSVAVVEQADNA